MFITEFLREYTGGGVGEYILMQMIVSPRGGLGKRDKKNLDD